MNENKPNWVDKANLASNLVQNLQLHDIHSALSALVSLQAQWACSEANARLAQDQEDRLRECVWRMETSFRKFVEPGNLTASGAYVVAKQIRTALQFVGVTTASFRQFQDKDRLDHFESRIKETLSQSEARLTPEQKLEAETFLRYEEEIKELDYLITHSEKREKWVNASIAVKDLQTKLRQVRDEILQLQPPTFPTFDRIVGSIMGVGEEDRSEQQKREKRLKKLLKKAQELEESAAAAAAVVQSEQPLLTGAANWRDLTPDQQNESLAHDKEYTRKDIAYTKKYGLRLSKHRALKAERTSFLEKFQQTNGL